MNSKNLATKRSLIVLLLLCFLPLQARAELHLEFGIEPSYTIPFKNPAKSYYKDLNEDFRTGRYTFTTPIPQWEDIKTPSFNEFGGEGSCLVRLMAGKIKNPRVGIVLGYRISSPRSTYNKSYDIWDEKYKGGSYIPTNFKGKENIHTGTFFLGARGKANLIDKLDVSTTLGVNFYKVKGDIDYTMDRLDNPYVQWRETDYKGNGTGFVIEAGVDCKVVRNMFAGASFGYRTGKVQTKGKHVVTTSNDPEKEYVFDYNPEFSFNSTYGKFYFGISF